MKLFLALCLFAASLTAAGVYSSTTQIDTECAAFYQDVAGSVLSLPPGVYLMVAEFQATVTSEANQFFGQLVVNGYIYPDEAKLLVAMPSRNPSEGIGATVSKTWIVDTNGLYATALLRARKIGPSGRAFAQAGTSLKAIRIQ